MCWRFEVLEGENQVERLLRYAQAFGKHGSGNDEFDKYVIEFQRRVTGLWVIWFAAGQDNFTITESGSEEE